MKKKGGRPLSLQKSVRGMILDYLGKHGGARYSTLAKDARGPDRIAHRVLDNALKQLLKAKLIMKCTVMHEGKAITHYILTPLPPAMVSGSEANSYHEWIQETAGRLVEKGSMGPELLEKTMGKTMAKMWVDTGGVMPMQEYSLRMAAKWLGVIILGIIGEANTIQNEGERARYLHMACSDYLPGFISEAARLAPPLLGDPRVAVRTAIDGMAEQGWFFRMMWQIPASVDLDEGSGPDVQKYREYAETRDGSRPGI